MHLIGKGYWYAVFDLGNGRVLKIEKDFVQKLKDSYIYEGRMVSPWVKVLYTLFTKRTDIKSSYKYLERNVDLKLLGSPKFLESINYEQEKSVTLGEAMMYSNDSQKREIIDKYIQNIIECWRNGFADTVYNFTINNGLNTIGGVILLDFNEITFSKAEVRNHIQLKRWSKSWSLTQIDQNLKEYYLNQMNMKLSFDSLDQNWSSK